MGQSIPSTIDGSYHSSAPAVWPMPHTRPTATSASSRFRSSLSVQRPSVGASMATAATAARTGPTRRCRVTPAATARASAGVAKYTKRVYRSVGARIQGPTIPIDRTAAAMSAFDTPRRRIATTTNTPRMQTERRLPPNNSHAASRGNKGREHAFLVGAAAHLAGHARIRAQPRRQTDRCRQHPLASESSGSPTKSASSAAAGNRGHKNAWRHRPPERWRRGGAGAFENGDAHHDYRHHRERVAPDIVLVSERWMRGQYHATGKAGCQPPTRPMRHDNRATATAANNAGATRIVVSSEEPVTTQTMCSINDKAG